MTESITSTLRRAKGSEVLPKVILGYRDAETVCLLAADEIESLIAYQIPDVDVLAQILKLVNWEYQLSAETLAEAIITEVRTRRRLKQKHRIEHY